MEHTELNTQGRQANWTTVQLIRAKNYKPRNTTSKIKQQMNSGNRNEPLETQVKHWKTQYKEKHKHTISSEPSKYILTQIPTKHKLRNHTERPQFKLITVKRSFHLLVFSALNVENVYYSWRCFKKIKI